MDLFAFIRHADPTKVKVREKEAQDGEGTGNDDVNKRVNDVAKASQAERGDRVVDIGGIEIVANDEIQAIVADKPKKIKKKGKVTDGAGGSVYPPKKLREDYGTSSNGGASVAGKSLIALQGLLERITLAEEVGVTEAATVLFVMSFVTPTPEYEGGEGSDFATGPIIRMRPALERSSVPPPHVLTVAVTTTVVPGATSVQVHDLGVGQVNPSIFKDSASPTMAEADVAGPSQPVGTDLSAGSFYISQHMDVETLRQAETGGEEAKATKAIRLCGQIAAVEAAEATRITELNSLRERNVSLEGQVAALESAVVSKDAEIASSQSQVTKLTHDLFSLRLSYDELSVKASSLVFEKAKLVDQTGGNLSDHVAIIDSDLMDMVLHMDAEFYPRYLTTIVGRRWILSRGVRLVLAKCLASPEYLSAMVEALGRAIDKGIQDGLTAGIKHGRAKRSIADVAAFNPFAEGDYVAAINALRDVNFPLLAQLKANKDYSMADIMDLLRLEGPVAEVFKASQRQPSSEQLMVLIHRLEDQVIIRETPLDFSLEVAYNRVQRVRGDTTARRLSLTDSILPLVEPLSARSLTGEASSFAVLATAVTTALSSTFSQTDLVPSVLSTEVPPSSKIIFEEEELDTTPEHVLAL
uniref:Transposase (Putative), gypsy type n=1 Tax=Tanacetum cinerariifolium TaxID=118510 RepID=A0A6L2MQ30_TANCI|nr:hypothetical protein [Tanacetum cinerariifolium]